MNTLRLLIITLLCCPMLGFAQENNIQFKLTRIDSLMDGSKPEDALPLLEDLEGQISNQNADIKIRFHKLYGDYYLRVRKHQLSAKHYEEVRSITPETKEGLRDKARAINDQGIAYYRINEIEKAKQCHFVSLKLYNECKDFQGRAFNFNNLATVYMANGQEDSAYQYQQLGIEAAELANDTLGIAFGNLNLGIGYHNGGHYIKALPLVLKSIAIFEAMKDSARVNFVKMKLSIMYMDLNDYDKSWELLDEVAPYFQSTKNIYQQGRIYTNRAVILENRKLYEQSFAYQDTAMNLFIQLDNPRWKAFAYLMRAKTFHRLEAYDSTRKYLTLSLEAGKDKHWVDVANAYQELIQLNIKEGKFLEAETIAKKVMDNGRKLTASLQAMCYEAAYRYNKSKGKLSQALEAYEESQRWADSASVKDKGLDIARAEYQYKSNQEQALFETEKANISLKLAQQEQRTYFALAGLLALTLIAILAIRSYRLKQRANIQLRALNNEISSQREEIAVQAEELKANNEQLLQLGQFKESMTGMIVHDLKNPLSVILSNAEGNKQVEGMAQQMLQLVTNMLDVQKFGEIGIKLHAEPVAISQLFHETVEQVSALLPARNLQIDQYYEPSMGVMADYALLARVLVNLLTNAIKYAPANTVIHLKAINEGDRQICLLVKDFGSGISEEQLTNIFQAYGQADAKHSGGVASTGLGLTFCKQVVEAHNGQLQVNTSAGEGTSFYFYLPAVIIEANKAPQQVQQNEKPWGTEDLKMLQETVTSLRGVPIYKISFIEQQLLPLKGHSDKIDQWIDAVLEAAYNDNETHYKTLIKEVEAA